MSNSLGTDALFLTDCSVGRGRPNGWIVQGSRRALLCQGFLSEQHAQSGMMTRSVRMMELWDANCRSFDPGSLAAVVISCGDQPDLAIIIASTFDPSKVRLIHCGCGKIKYFEKFQDHRMLASGYINGACGGVDAAEEALQAFLNGGTIPFQRTLADVLEKKS